MLRACLLATIAYVVNVDFCYEAPISSCVHFCDPVKGADETITGSPLSSCKMGFAMGSWTPSPERTPSPRAAGFGPIVIVVGMLMLTDVNMYTKVYLGDYGGETVKPLKLMGSGGWPEELQSSRPPKMPKRLTKRVKEAS